MKIQHSFLSVLILSILLLSCSDDGNTDPGTDTDKEVVELEMLVTKTQLRLFEPTDIGIADLRPYSAYDSIVWSIPGVFKDVSMSNSTLLYFTQSFHLPGDYKASVSGYKEGEVISADTVGISVDNSGDFLGLEWSNIANYQPFNYLKRTAKDNIEYLINMSIVDNPVLFVKMDYQFGTDYLSEQEWIAFHKHTKKEYYDYIVSLYGNPVFNYTNDDISQSNLTEEYNSRFTVRLYEIEQNSVYVPVTIWETPTAYIALVGSIKSGIETEINYFKVIAQPIIK